MFVFAVIRSYRIVQLNSTRRDSTEKSDPIGDEKVVVHFLEGRKQSNKPDFDDDDGPLVVIVGNGGGNGGGGGGTGSARCVCA